MHGNVAWTIRNLPAFLFAYWDYGRLFPAWYFSVFSALPMYCSIYKKSYYLIREKKNPSGFSFHMQTRFKLLNSPLLGEEK